MTTLLDVARWLELSGAKAMAARVGMTYPVSLRDLIGRVVSGAPKIEHVFVLMLENRSFDHMLGFAGLTGTSITGQPTKALDLTMVPTLLDAARLWDPPLHSVRDIAQKLGIDSSSVTLRIGPSSLSVRALLESIHSNRTARDAEPVFPDTSAPFEISKADAEPNCELPRHEFSDVLLTQLGDGISPRVNNRGFLRNSNAEVMRCFAPENVPILVALAREFAVCDRPVRG